MSIRCSSSAGRRLGLLLAVAVLALPLPSCKEGRKPVYPVHGRIVDGRNRPVAGALLVFHPVDAHDPATPRCVAHTEADGSFLLTTYTQGDGAPAGEYTVTIVWPPPRKTPFEPEGPDQLKGRYSDPKTSSHRVSVRPLPANEVPLIRLPEKGGPG